MTEFVCLVSCVKGFFFRDNFAYFTSILDRKFFIL